jgi:Cu-Zn family superoxide dismutase
MKSRSLSQAALLIAAAALAVGCGSTGGSASTSTSTSKPAGGGASAQATLESKSGSAVTGTAAFTELADGWVRVHVHIENATPGSHGLHVHEKGDCSTPDATSAGGHFNPAGNPHAAPTAEKRHAGDFGNVEIGSDGKGDLEVRTDQITVKPGPNSVVGRAVVFHEKTDDLTTQPTGNAGARFACGVVK